MEHISSRVATVGEQTVSPNILVVCRTFLPREGGIEEYIYNRCLQDAERVIVLTASCAGDKAFDKSQLFPVYRWQTPKSWGHSWSQNILQPFLNTVWSAILAIKLYFRYHYRYIEWGHGYGFISLLFLSYLLPIRFFIYLHGDDILCALRNPIMRSLFALTLQRAEGIVCNSCWTRDLLTRHFEIDTPTHVIHPVVRRKKFGVATPTAIDDLRIRVRNRHNIPENAIVILSVGSLQKYKGFDLVIDNLPLLLTLGLDVHYILCGRGPCESKLQSQVQRLRLDRWVHFAGYVADRELAGYYAACDIFALLTLFDCKANSHLGFGMVYLEAAYFGKPVIASNIGCASDTVRQRENGLIVNPYSGLEIFQAFRQLCENQQLREQLGRRGKILANKRSLHRWLYIPESRYSCLLT
ncbi:glycosyl transferase family 1 [Fischerella thermalis CCMEE 5268]|uniref:Glycosyl transferase family 1 n=1 Tax=Fischerella thermalis CCMEE 5268 TaxID=2019662 RepID=A0A2N6KIL5_9CYAN|nr:glycosyltransferase family 4 protein [Fischerella thermalis]PLZ99350.1 glycosyl transferase family 1 [Fischerella thermalis CCMEE 5268]